MYGVLSPYLNDWNGSMKWFSQFVLVVLISACAGCAAQEPVNGWRIELVQSGGVAGLMRTTRVESTGEFSVVNRAGDTLVQRIMTAEELAYVEELISRVGSQKHEKMSRSVTSRCRDCYHYHVTIETGSGLLDENIDSISLKNSPYRTLINELLKMGK